MRCIVGVVLFLVLYFGGCNVLGAAVAARHGGYSHRAAATAGAQAVTKYHALVAVGVGVVAILGCSLPTLLLKYGQRNECEGFDQDQRRR